MDHLRPVTADDDDLPAPPSIVDSDATLPSANYLQLPAADLLNRDNNEDPRLETATTPSPANMFTATATSSGVTSFTLTILSSQSSVSSGTLAMSPRADVNLHPALETVDDIDDNVERNSDDSLPSPQSVSGSSTASGEGTNPSIAHTQNLTRNPTQPDTDLPERVINRNTASDARRAPLPGWVADLSGHHDLAGSVVASERAETLIKCMEVISEDMVRRYEKLRACDSQDTDGCAICQGDLVNAEYESPDSSAIDASLAGRLGPTVAFPCVGKHLFHAGCLFPWMERNATCPYCRFNIDPQLRMSRGPLSAWKPPVVETMCEWLVAEEKARKTGVPRERPVAVMPDSAPSSYDFDPQAFAIAFPEFGDLERSALVGDSSLNFERDFAAWFDPENALDHAVPVLEPSGSDLNASSRNPQERADPGALTVMGGTNLNLSFERDFATWFLRNENATSSDS